MARLVAGDREERHTNPSEEWPLHLLAENAALGAYTMIFESCSIPSRGLGPRAEGEGEILEVMFADRYLTIQDSRIDGNSGMARVQFRGHSQDLSALFRRSDGAVSA
jgi:hypothetical protein